MEKDDLKHTLRHARIWLATAELLLDQVNDDLKQVEEEGKFYEQDYAEKLEVTRKLILGSIKQMERVTKNG